MPTRPTEPATAAALDDAEGVSRRNVLSMLGLGVAGILAGCTPEAREQFLRKHFTELSPGEVAQRIATIQAEERRRFATDVSVSATPAIPGVAFGYGLDLSRCAATGVTDDLVWVSPRTGRAVSRAAGEPYADRLLPLPGFLLGSQGGLREGDICAGFDLTGHFLEQFVFGPLNRPLPPARVWLLERLADAGRL